MKNRNYGLYAVAIAIVVVGAIWAGLPISTLAVFGLVLVCPLMMFAMMRGMGGSGMGGMHGGGDRNRDADKQPEPADRPATHDHGALR
jgi:hypothetical protein